MTHRKRENTSAVSSTKSTIFPALRQIYQKILPNEQNEIPVNEQVEIPASTIGQPIITAPTTNNSRKLQISTTSAPLEPLKQIPYRIDKGSKRSPQKLRI